MERRFQRHCPFSGNEGGILPPARAMSPARRHSDPATACRRQRLVQDGAMTGGRFLATLAASGCAPLHAGEAGYVRHAPEGPLQCHALREASGLASSPGGGDFLWLINDSGSPAEIHLAGTDGTDRGKISLEGTRNLDWEDLASFMHGGKPYLLVADCGDNAGLRGECQLHIVPEPALPGSGEQLEGRATPAWTIRFRYEDGPRDCESVAVDEKTGKILLLSKRTSPPLLYELPLKPDTDEIRIARKTGSIPASLPAGFPPVPYGTQPTGMDIRADGGAAAVVTYAGAFLFPRKGGESWATAFSRPPVVLEKHLLRQAESVAFSRDGKVLRAVSEGGKSPLVCYRREEKDAE